MYNAYVTKIHNIRKHPNADRLNLGECFGNTVIIGKDYDENTLYIYFPTDGQLSEEYATINNLLRKKDENGNNVGGYLDPVKRNICAVRLRGEKSDGLVMPLSSVEYTGVDMSTLTEGVVITMLNGREICRKYIPRSNASNRPVNQNGNRTRKKKIPVAPLFAEHADTEQLAYNLAAFHPGDQIEVTLKMHGTSQRTGYLPIFQKYKRNIIDIIFNKEGTPVYDWGYVSGTRRTVLDNYGGGYYGNNEFREGHSKKFEGKLWKGEEVYYEVVGFTTTGTPIMSAASNKKLNDKEFVKKYGETTVFSYGCSPDGKEIKYENGEKVEYDVPQSNIYVYRMTMTNEDGNVVEYTPEFMRYRCEQMGIKCVPVLEKFFIPNDVENAGEYVQNRIQKYLNTDPDPIGKTHIKEGVVVRIINRAKFTAYKDKVFEFKVLEGIMKSAAAAPDIEEAEELIKEGDES